MARYYRNPDPDRNPELTQGNVVIALRDYDAESLPERQRFPRAVSDVELCCYVEFLYLCGKHDNFKKYPEYKKGIEIRCENRGEAEYLDRLMWERYTTVIRYTVTYHS